MFALTAVLATALSLPAAQPGAPTDAKTELAKWQGTWEVELHLSGGKEKPANERTIKNLVVKDDVWELHFKDREEPIRGKMTFELTGKAKALDVAVGKVVFRSIYILDGDRAVVRVGEGDEERPKDFSTSANTKTGAILIYQRVKK